MVILLLSRFIKFLVTVKNNIVKKRGFDSKDNKEDDKSKDTDCENIGHLDEDIDTESDSEDAKSLLLLRINRLKKNITNTYNT